MSGGRTAQTNVTWSVITDTLGGRGTPNSSPWSTPSAKGALVSGLITDTLGGRGTPGSSPWSVAAPKSVVHVSTPSAGFSWTSAGIGAGITAALAALLAAAAFAARRQQRNPAF